MIVTLTFMMCFVAIFAAVRAGLFLYQDKLTEIALSELCAGYLFLLFAVALNS